VGSGAEGKSEIIANFALPDTGLLFPWRGVPEADGVICPGIFRLRPSEIE
jgi:hypothetical protein